MNHLLAMFEGNHLNLTTCWYAATLTASEFKKKFPRRVLRAMDIAKACDDIEQVIEETDDEREINYYLLSVLMVGVRKIYSDQVFYFNDEMEWIILHVLKALKKSDKKKKKPATDNRKQKSTDIIEKGATPIQSPEHDRPRDSANVDITMSEPPVFIHSSPEERQYPSPTATQLVDLGFEQYIEGNSDNDETRNDGMRSLAPPAVRTPSKRLRRHEEPPDTPSKRARTIPQESTRENIRDIAPVNDEVALKSIQEYVHEDRIAESSMRIEEFVHDVGSRTMNNLTNEMGAVTLTQTRDEVTALTLEQLQGNSADMNFPSFDDDKYANLSTRKLTRKRNKKFSDRRPTLPPITAFNIFDHTDLQQVDLQNYFLHARHLFVIPGTSWLRANKYKKWNEKLYGNFRLMTIGPFVLARNDMEVEREGISTQQPAQLSDDIPAVVSSGTQQNIALGATSANIQFPDVPIQDNIHERSAVVNAEIRPVHFNTASMPTEEAENIDINDNQPYYDEERNDNQRAFSFPNELTESPEIWRREFITERLRQLANEYQRVEFKTLVPYGTRRRNAANAFLYLLELADAAVLSLYQESSLQDIYITVNERFMI